MDPAQNPRGINGEGEGEDSGDVEGREEEAVLEEEQSRRMGEGGVRLQRSIFHGWLTLMLGLHNKPDKITKLTTIHSFNLLKSPVAIMDCRQPNSSYLFTTTSLPACRCIARSSAWCNLSVCRPLPSPPPPTSPPPSPPPLSPGPTPAPTPPPPPPPDAVLTPTGDRTDPNT